MVNSEPSTIAEDTRLMTLVKFKAIVENKQTDHVNNL